MIIQEATLICCRRAATGTLRDKIVHLQEKEMESGGKEKRDRKTMML